MQAIWSRAVGIAPAAALQPALWCLPGMKTLIVAEKPSVGRDIAGA